MITLWGCCIHISQFRWVLDPSFPLFYRLCFFRHPSAGHNTLCAQNPECTRVHFILQWMESKRGRKGISRTNISGSRSSPRHPSSQRVLYVFWIHAFKLCLIVFWKCLVSKKERKGNTEQMRCCSGAMCFDEAGWRCFEGGMCWWGRVAVRAKLTRVEMGRTQGRLDHPTQLPMLTNIMTTLALPPRS